MGTNERLFWRELGCRRPTMGRSPKLLEGSLPLAFERSFNSSEDLMKRLSQTAEFRGDAASVSNVTWSPDGQFLAAGGEDCRVTVWEPGTRQLKQTIDMGHTSFINSVRYLPSRNNEYIVSASNDKEVRLANLVKGAIMPYKNHKGKVKSIAVIDPAMFMTAGEDGTVRQVDLRDNCRAMTLIADQRGEKTGLVKSRVPINSIALCPLHPHLFATGGGDAIVRLYDRRMSSGQGSKPHKTPWFAGYMPMHFKSTLAHRPRPMPPLRPNVHISGVAFSHDGRKLFASYTNEQIYSFSCKQHQRAAAYFEAPDPSAHATRSTARLHRPTERRWPTAARSRDSAEAAQPSARATAQHQQQQERAQREAEAASAARAAAWVAARDGQAAEHAPGTVPLATAITMATQHFVQSFQTQPPDEAFRDRVRELAEEIHAQAAPAPEGASGEPEEAQVPDEAQPRRAASAPMPEVGQGAEAFTVGSFANAFILGVNAAFQQGQAGAADTARGAEQDLRVGQARSASRRQPARATAAASVAEGDAIAPVEEEEQQEARAPRQASRRGGSRGRLASRSGSAQAPLAQSIGRVAPGPARESPSALEASHTVPPIASQVMHSPVTRQAARRAGQPHQATRPAGALAAADQGLGAAAQSPNRLRLTQRDSRIQARREEAEAELARVGPPARRQRRTLDEPGSPRQSAMSAPRQPVQIDIDLPAHAAHATFAHGGEAQAADAARPVRQTASTLAAAGNAFAVAGRTAERPTASTGTSRPLTRQQASLKKEEGSPDVPEQASGHTGQPRAFRAPLPRTRGACHAATAALGAAEGGPMELPAGQVSQQMPPVRQRRMRQGRPDVSDCHSGAGSTSRRAARPSGQQEQLLPGSARQAQAAVGEASSGLPTAQPAAPGQPQLRQSTRAVGTLLAQHQSQHLGAAAQINSTGDRDDQNALDITRTGAARRRQSRAAPAAAGGSEPDQDAEDVCCERTQSGRGQDKRSTGAASPASVQRAPAEQCSAQPAENATGTAAAALSAAERPAHAQACTDEAGAAAGQQASPQQATIQDGASQGPRQRQLGTGQQHQQAAAANAMGTSVQTDVPEGVSEVGAVGGPARLLGEPAATPGQPPPNEYVMAASAQQRGLDSPLPARSSPNSSAAAIDTVQEGDDEADVVGPSAQQRRARLGAARAGTARAGEGREQQQGADSYIGAILDVCDADDGEVVEEDGMFDMVYSGHCNKQGCKEVSLIGEHSDFVCSGSDGGSIFIWNAQTGQLVNVLRANETVTTCVAPHPHVPMLASCGFEPAVRLWSPEAGEATKLEHAGEVMRQNALELAQRSEHQIAAPQILLNMGLMPPAAAQPAPAPAPEQHLHLHLNNRDNAVRCTIM